MRELFIGKNADITSFFSMAYMMFFLPLCILFYSLVPNKAKKYYMLGISLLFYTLISGVMVIYLVFTILFMYYFAGWIDRNRTKAKGPLILANIIQFIIFILLTTVFIRFNIRGYFIPIGIFFIILQSTGYVIDVYKGRIKADNNLCRVALYMSFFPKISGGPVCSYKELSVQIYNIGPIKYDNFKRGFVRIFYGLMKKLVVADRLNAFTMEVLKHYETYKGGLIILAAAAYIVQIYMNLSGFMDATIGSAEIFGITLPENFRNTFFSKTLLEFWGRFNITVGLWIKTYIFIPLYRSMKNKWIPAFLFSWLFIGFWYGLMSKVVVFCLFNFSVITLGRFIKNIFGKKINGKLINVIRYIRTFFLVMISGLILRNDDGLFGIRVIKNIFSDFGMEQFSKDLCQILVFDISDLVVVILALLMIACVGIMYEKGHNVREWLFRQHTVVRWSLLYFMLLITVIFGAYGKGYIGNMPFFNL